MMISSVGFGTMKTDRAGAVNTDPTLTETPGVSRSPADGYYRTTIPSLSNIDRSVFPRRAR